MQRTVIYARVSTEDQLEKYGLPSQLRACRDNAAGRLNVIEEITDDGVSGTILDRPGLSRIRRMVRAGEVDVVLMLDVDRLSRELAHLLILKPEIERHARLEFVTAKFEDSPSGRMFFGIRGVIGQYERELTRERTMRGKKERAQAGLIVGGRVAFGYLYADGRLSEDPDRAPIVRRIFAGYDSGSSLRGITAVLQSSATPTWSGRDWCKSSVRRILSNETYAGIAHYGTHRREGKLIRLRENVDRIALPVTPLVGREQWERVQARLAANPMVGRPSTGFLLRGLLHCGNCGKRMYGESSRTHRSYRCAGRDRLLADPCRNHANGKDLDAAVWRALVRTFTDAETLKQAIGRRQQELRESEVDLDEIRKRLGKLRRREEAVLGAMFDPDLSEGRGAIKAEYKTVVADRRRIEAELAAHERAQASRMSPEEWVEQTVKSIRAFVQNLVDQKLRQEFVKRLVTRAEWNGEEIRMECFIAPELATTF
jgi:site-specific DNA recombinase